jgi:hypothetical protein
MLYQYHYNRVDEYVAKTTVQYYSSGSEANLEQSKALGAYGLVGVSLRLAHAVGARVAVRVARQDCIQGEESTAQSIHMLWLCQRIKCRTRSSQHSTTDSGESVDATHCRGYLPACWWWWLKSSSRK